MGPFDHWRVTPSDFGMSQHRVLLSHTIGFSSRPSNSDVTTRVTYCSMQVNQIIEKLVVTDTSIKYYLGFGNLIPTGTCIVIQF